MSSSPFDIGTCVAERFELLEIIGEGGMGIVYRARQVPLEREVALKVILAERSGTSAARERFIREAKVASRLHHPNAVEIFDFGEYEGHLYLAMELLPGDNLREYVDFDKDPLPLTEALNATRQIASVLQVAGELSLVHRDLKPENILVDRRGDIVRYVVADFGLAFISESDDDTGRLTQEGVVTGTPDYMSPEQARGSKVGPASDIYALGCMLYEMLCANPPFDGDPAILLSRHLFVAPEPLRNAYPEYPIPGRLDDLIMAMLAKRAEERPSAGELIAVIEAIDGNDQERSSALQKDGQVVGRKARMVSKSYSSPPTYENEMMERTLVVATTIRVDDVSALALAANGIQLSTITHLPLADEAFKCDAVLLADLPEHGLEAFRSRHTVPILVLSSDSSTVALTGLMRQGVDAVIKDLADVDKVARTIWRTIKRNERRRR